VVVLMLKIRQEKHGFSSSTLALAIGLIEKTCRRSWRRVYRRSPSPPRHRLFELGGELQEGCLVTPPAGSVEQ